MAGESCDDSCVFSVSSTWRKIWGSSYAILVWVWELKVTDEPQDKNDMQAWLGEVLMIKDYVEFLKWNEEKVLSYELRNNFIYVM
jgi:hypothetical protein